MIGGRRPALRWCPRAGTGLALVATLLAAGCQSREIVAICATFGDPDGQLTAVAHGPEGQQVSVLSEAAAGETTIVTQSFEDAILPRLWLLAEPTIRALSEVDASPCGLSDVSTVTVTFDDGTVQRRETSCSGNALAILTTGIFEASEIDRAPLTHDSEIVAEVTTTAAQACERAYERF